MGSLKSTEEFINQSKAIHGDRYDYSKSIYVGNRLKLTIGCKEHGEFLQMPQSHLAGHGCSKCANLPRKSAEEFIVNSKKIHGDRYDYKHVKYTGFRNKVLIHCSVHGAFMQTPRVHLDGHGCPVCAIAKSVSTTEKFVEQARNIHGNTYNYSSVCYELSKIKVAIICDKHGIFYQVPSNHIRGAGCPACVGRNKTTEEYITEARSVHNDKYDYSGLVYKSSVTKVNILCREHGVFLQSPSNHLFGAGCPKCVKHGFNPNEGATVYTYTFGEYVGFGITNDFKTRNRAHIRNFKKKGVDATLVATYNMSGELAKSLEKQLKNTLPIIDSGIDGFKTEAAHISSLQRVLDTIKEYINDPEI